MSSHRCATFLAGFALIFSLAATAEEQPKRYPIPSLAMKQEIGHCYTLNMDFGEPGDKESKNQSGLLLFENGKALGLARAPHNEIREKGGGLYSHWLEQTLYFSTSDNSDPRTNGRRYEIASTNPESTLGGIGEIATPIKRHTEVIHSSHQEYTIHLGGHLDFENSHTRHNNGFNVAFQPNVSLTIANTGDQPVLWPKLVANGLRDWSTYDRLLEDFTRGAKNDQERALFIWQTARDNRYHCSPLFPDHEFHDPVKMFNSYGLNLCDDMGYCGVSLFKNVGLGKPKYSIDPKIRHLNGHMMGEAVVDNRYQFLDIDASAFYLDRENERQVSGDECARDHDLVRREVHFGPVFTGWSSSNNWATLFGKDDSSSQSFQRGHEMRYTLRPGERVVFRWDNIGKYAAYSEEWDHQPPVFGNSKFIYAPRLGEDPQTGPLVYAVDTPWVICGGTLRAEFTGDAQDKFALDVQLDDHTVTRVWEGTGPQKIEIGIDEALQPRRAPAKYHYEVIVTVPGAGAKLKSLEIETDVMTAPMSLPRLRLAENKFVYSDQQEGAHELTITHEWQECEKLKPLSPPANVEYPPAGATVRDSILTFRWPAVESAKAYHMQVSLREDFRIPYRPAYDVIIPETEWTVPYTGMFSPEQTYYWRVRCRNKWGIWSDWGPTQTFQWEGPRVPLKVRAEKSGDGMVLRWEANPKGIPPVAYEVYGSDEKGFSISKAPYDSYTRGTVPANFLGRTTDTKFPVVSPTPEHENMNKCYYRVVAVDANGTESICSDYAELPHPHFWSQAPTKAKLGTPFSYRAGVITSLGDAQHRYAPKGDGFWEAEELSFTLSKGPAWMKVDAKTGELTGTPDAIGKVHVTLEASTQFEGRTTQEFDLIVE